MAQNIDTIRLETSESSHQLNIKMLSHPQIVKGNILGLRYSFINFNFLDQKLHWCFIYTLWPKFKSLCIVVPHPHQKKSHISHSADIGLDINVCDSSIINTLIKYGLFELLSQLEKTKRPFVCLCIPCIPLSFLFFWVNVLWEYTSKADWVHTWPLESCIWVQLPASTQPAYDNGWDALWKIWNLYFGVIKYFEIFLLSVITELLESPISRYVSNR